jgi:hypothetical protein
VTVLIVLAVLTWTLVFVLAVLGKLLRATPGRTARISVRPLPWPRIDIDLTAHDAHTHSDHEISTE